MTSFVFNVKKKSERQEQTLTVQSETKTAFLKCIIYMLQQQGHTIYGSEYAEVFNKKIKHKYIHIFKQALNFSLQLDECIYTMSLDTVLLDTLIKVKS
jgi:regulation of enolase protein 1 (concanavalin A-like superfamily)